MIIKFPKQFLSQICNVNHRMITITGSGGKTSLMYTLADVLRQAGYPSVSTSTTKLARSFNNQLVEQYTASSIEDCILQLKKLKNLNCSKLATLIERVDFKSNKLIGLPAAWIDYLYAYSPDTNFIVEGDGSCGLSLKGYLRHEPVIPTKAGLVITVVGIDVLNRPCTNKYVHRAQCFCDLTESQYGTQITENMLLRSLLHPRGYRQHIPPKASIIPFINKADNKYLYAKAHQLAVKLFSGQPSPAGILLGSMKNGHIEFLNSNGVLT